MGVFDERPSPLIRDKPVLSSERMLYKDYYRKGSAEKQNSGRESWSNFDFGFDSEFSWLLSCGALTSGHRREHKSWRFSIVKIRYQETASEIQRRSNLYSTDL
jgi:hypothetical protein